MRYLMRDGAPLTESQWARIDGAVVEEASKILVGRRFLDVTVAGARAQSADLDSVEAPGAAAADFWGREGGGAVAVAGRRFVELAAVYADFMISWRDIENEDAGARAARDAAVLAAKREDEMIFSALFAAKGAHKQAISDWSKGEGAVADLAKCIEALQDAGNSGERALIVSTDLYAKLHRIQPGTGMMEVDRVRSLAGKLFHSNRLNKNTACLVYCDPQNMDLVVGQDLITAYMGNEKLDHVFRVMETVVPRIRRASAIAILK